MNTFIETHKPFFKFYYAALRLSGWLLLTLGLCGTGIVLLMARNLGPTALGIATINTDMNSLEFILFGLLGLGIAQLIRYLLETDAEPGFVLRHGSAFLYGYGVLILLVTALRISYSIYYSIHAEIENPQGLLIMASSASVILFLAKALILIGAAQFLKRIKPIIEEHKSLV